MTRVTCPACGFVFSVRDIHRPVRCPRCGALLDFPAPDFQPRVLMEEKDMMGGE